MPKPDPRPAGPDPPGTYAGLALVALATLLAELTLMRVFSVVLHYHFAMVAVSLALFGMTVGAVIVHLLPERVKAARRSGVLALASLLFGLSLAAATWIVLTTNWLPAGSTSDLGALTSLYLLLAVPFTFSGIAVSLALTGSVRQVNRLYAADLTGAAAGCVIMAVAIRWLGGGGVLVAAGLLAAAGGCCFSWGGRWPLRAIAGLGLASLVVLLALGTSGRWFELRYTKGRPVLPPEFEAWNAFSRIGVWELIPGHPAGFGGSIEDPTIVEQKRLDIDAAAATPLTRFNGDLGTVSWFRKDMTSLGHHLRSGGKVLVIGVGGGRDVLISLACGQKLVVGVELNDLVLRALNQDFGDFTGHLDRRPDVRMVNDEARSYISRSGEQYDVITCSLIDTWAATAAGAFVFTENGLYTLEAWRTFLEHLTDRGVLVVTRWYDPRFPTEVLRLLSLARGTLERYWGVRDATNYVVAVKRDPPPGARLGVGTVLVSRTPFTAQDRRIAEQFCRDNRFDLLVAPGYCPRPDVKLILSDPNVREQYAGMPVDITPPTDDRPFFFHMLKLGTPADVPALDRNMEAMQILNRFISLSIVLTLVFVVLPLGLGAIGKQYHYAGVLPLLGFFAAIGLGFMLVEISQMQRLMIYLGHPLYGVAVVLFSLLLASGLGSLASKSVSGRLGPGKVMAVLVAVLLAFALLVPLVSAWGRAWPTPARLALALATMLPMGFLMGMPFPMGMTTASRNPRAPLAWYWGVNGATSVLASVLAMAFSLYWGVTVTCGLGLLCYLAAATCLVLASRTKQPA